MKWLYPKTLGKYPPSRYAHTMNYHKPLYSLIIHGGRNDYENVPFLDDIHILNCKTLIWVEILIKGKTPL